MPVPVTSLSQTLRGPMPVTSLSRALRGMMRVPTATMLILRALRRTMSALQA
jgi:hypothetical protein